MNNQTTSRNSIPLLNELVTDYFRALEAGGRPNPEDWVARYPEYASELREFFEGHLHVDLIAGPLREAIPLSETTPFAQQGTVSIPFGPGACFADYELLEEIARGGMGVVFKAKQRSLNRIVAVKMIRPDVVAAHDMSRFFHSEAEIAAHLDHPNIVPVYEVGQHDGQHYFSMKLIDGPSLGQFLSREIETKGFENGRLAPCVCVDLLVPIARAVHHAHQRGILHRDLKPSNILLEGSNSESMTPFVSDFGLAKRIDKDQSQTITGEIIGTPLYMSPEQATGEKRITTATDVYSLGAILYEILAGRPPFQSDNLFDTLWQVRHREPDSPRKFNRKVDRDLETICRKCLEKEPAQRYGSAEALADDLDRWRKGEPIQARRASAWEQCRKWVKRQPAIASMGLAIVALIGIVIGVLFVRLGQTSARLSLTETRAGAYQKQAEDRRRDVERSKRETQLVQAHLALEKGMNRIEQGQIGPGLLWLARGLEVVPPDATELNHSLRMLLGGWRNSLFTLEGGLPFRSELDAVALSPDGKIAFVGGPISAQLWDLAAGKRLGPLLRYGGEQLLAVNFSADNKEVTTLVGGESATLQRWNVQNGKRVGKPWSLASPKEQRDGAYPYFCSAAFSADGKRVLTGSFRDQMTYQARLWDPTVARMQTGENPCLRELQIPTDRTRDFHVALSADGKLALRWNNTGRDGGLLDNAILCWNIGKGEMTKRRIRYDGRIGAASVDPVQTTFKSRNILTVGTDGVGRLHSIDTGREIEGVRGYFGETTSLSFSSNGNIVLTGNRDQTAHLWRRPCSFVNSPIGTFAPPADQRAPGDSQLHVAFNPNGKTLVTHKGFAPGRAFLYTAADGKLLRSIPGVASLAYSPDGKLLLTGHTNGRAQLWSTSTGQLMDRFIQIGGKHPRVIRAVAFSPDGKTIATGTDIDSLKHAAELGGELRLWETSTAKPRGTPIRHDFSIRQILFTPDGDRIVTFCGARVRLAASRVQVWDSRTLKPVGKQLPYDAAPIAKLKRLYNAPWRGTNNPLEEIYALDISPDGKKLLVVERREETLRSLMIETQTGKTLGPPLQRQLVPSCLARFSPNGECYFAFDRLWNAHTHAPLCDRVSQSGTAAVFSPDGKLLLTNGTRIRFWDVATAKPVGPPLPIRRLVPIGVNPTMAFSPDGKMAVCGSLDKSATLWRVPQPWNSDVEEIRLWLEVQTGRRLDVGGAIVRLSEAERKKRWGQLKKVGDLDR